MRFIFARGGDLYLQRLSVKSNGSDTGRLTMTIRPAYPDEAEMLSALALRSKAYWGYSPDFLQACRAELTYTADMIRSDRLLFAICEVNASCTGFYALRQLSPDEVELEALFVEPAHIGKGYGRTLIEHAKSAAIALGASRMIIQGDPNADRFYLAAGGVLTGQRESGSIPGRFLPVYVIDLSRKG